MIIEGKEITWDEISRDQLKFLLIDEGLSNSSIANMFGVTVSKVQYKKTKFNLTGINIIYEKFVSENKALFDNLNAESREWFLNPQNIDLISKAITQFIFRNGPIESVHSKCKGFTDEEMKEINIYMVNHIAALLTYAFDGNWLQLKVLFDYFKSWSAEWYPAKADTWEIDAMFFMHFNLNAYEYNIPS